MKNTTKNIKFVPTYACKLGKGKFVGSGWQCSACGATSSLSHSSRPSPQHGTRCPSTASGNHIWVEI